MHSSNKRRRIAELHPPPDIDVFEARKVNDLRLKSRFESICTKYGRDFDNVGDEIDLRTGRIVIDNGHLEQIGEQCDTTGLWDDFHSDDNQTGLDVETPNSVARILPRSSKVPSVEVRQQREQYDTRLNRKYEEPCRELSIRPSDTICRGDYADERVTSHTAKRTPANRHGRRENANLLCTSIFGGRTRPDQAQSSHTASRWASRACPDSNYEGYHSHYESVGDRQHVRETQELIPASAKDIIPVVPPRQGQTLANHAESTLTLSRPDCPRMARPKNKRGRKGVPWLDPTVQDATRADSDSDDPLQQISPPLRSPSKAQFTDAKMSKRAKNAGVRIRQKMHFEFKNSRLLDTHEKGTATKRAQTETFANLDAVQVVASKDHSFDLSLPTSRIPLPPVGIAEIRRSAVLTPDEVKCLVKLRIMEKRPWSKVLAAMPQRDATQLKHWYYKYCVEARKGWQVSSRHWTPEEKRRLRSLQPSYHVSWEAVLSNFPTKTLDELQYEWTQACRDEFARQKKEQSHFSYAQSVTRETNTNDIRPGQVSKVLISSDLSTQAEGRPGSKTSMRSAKSESPDPLIGASGNAWSGISNTSMNK